MMLNSPALDRLRPARRCASCSPAARWSPTSGPRSSRTAPARTCCSSTDRTRPARCRHHARRPAGEAAAHRGPRHPGDARAPARSRHRRRHHRARRPGVPAGKGPTLCLGYYDDDAANARAVHRRRLDAHGRSRDDRRRRLPHRRRAARPTSSSAAARTSAPRRSRTRSRRIRRSRCARAVAMPDATFGERVCVFVELRAGHDAAHARRAPRAPRRSAAPARSCGPSGSSCSTRSRARRAARSQRRAPCARVHRERRVTSCEWALRSHGRRRSRSCAPVRCWPVPRGKCATHTAHLRTCRKELPAASASGRSPSRACRDALLLSRAATGRRRGALHHRCQFAVTATHGHMRGGTPLSTTTRSTATGSGVVRTTHRPMLTIASRAFDCADPAVAGVLTFSAQGQTASIGITPDTWQAWGTGASRLTPSRRSRARPASPPPSTTAATTSSTTTRPCCRGSRHAVAIRIPVCQAFECTRPLRDRDRADRKRCVGRGFPARSPIRHRYLSRLARRQASQRAHRRHGRRARRPRLLARRPTAALRVRLRVLPRLARRQAAQRAHCRYRGHQTATALARRIRRRRLRVRLRQVLGVARESPAQHADVGIATGPHTGYWLVGSTAASSRSEARPSSGRSVPSASTHRCRRWPPPRPGTATGSRRRRWRLRVPATRISTERRRSSFRTTRRPTRPALQHGRAAA